MKRKKIIFFGGVGSPTTFGGELTKNKEIIHRLRELGANVTVIDSFRARSRKLKLIRIMLRFFLNLLLHPRATFIFSTSFANVYPLFKILYRLPIRLHIVYWVIGGNLAERIVAGDYHPKYLRLVDLFIMEGVKMKERMVAQGFNNVWYEPNFKTIGTLPEIRKADDGLIHFFFLSRIMPDKGCRYIMQAVERLNDKGLSDRYVIDFYGNIDDDYRQEFDAAVQSFANVNYCGSIQLQDDANYAVLARYHYMLFPTYWLGEGFPGVVIDAYKAGVPIIASDWNLNPEFIRDGQTGIIVKTHDADSLCAAMEQAILGQPDNAAMSARCQREALRYDTRQVIDQSLYDVVTSGKTGGGKSLIHRLLKHNKTVYFTRYRLVDRDYRKHRKLMQTSTVKTAAQRKREMSLCRDYWHCPPMQYVRYGLYDRSLSEPELLDFIPAFRFYNGYMERQLRGVNEGLYSNKFNLYHIFRRCGIPTPEVIAVVRRGRLYDVDGNPIDEAAFTAALKPGAKYFFKPTDGAGGTGIEVLKGNSPEEYACLKAKLRTNRVYVVQEGIIQRRDFMEINPSSVNTLRIITQYNSSEPCICACVMRIGRNGRDVDNSHQGGMSCNIDLTDGSLNPTATAEHGGGCFDSHPDSGFRFSGHRIEGWEQIKAAVIAYAGYFPELKELGWDIAVTDRGVTVIEMNLGYGIAHLQVSCGGMRRRLSVYPDAN